MGIFWVLLFLVLLLFGSGLFFIFLCQVIALVSHGFPAAHLKVPEPPKIIPFDEWLEKDGHKPS